MSQYYCKSEPISMSNYFLSVNLISDHGGGNLETITTGDTGNHYQNI